jgi:ParB family chromosome partitioning protein
LVNFDNVGGSAEGETVVLLQLDPARVRIWKGNARVHEQLTRESTLELIESIDATGQHFPAIVRPIDRDPHFDYELIAGSRRHYAISSLRAQGRDIRLLAQVSNLGDEAAFHLSDTENRARQDISDLERARNYGWALNHIYDGSLGDMARAMQVSKSWLSKIIAVSKIPDAIIAAFSSPCDVKIKPAYALAQAVADTGRVARIRRDAAHIAREQAKLRDRGQPAIPAAEVLSLLLEKVPKSAVATWRSGTGAVALSLKNRSHAGLSIRVHAASGATREELVAAFREALAYMDDP